MGGWGTTVPSKARRCCVMIHILLAFVLGLLDGPIVNAPPFIEGDG